MKHSVIGSALTSSALLNDPPPVSPAHSWGGGGACAHMYTSFVSLCESALCCTCGVNLFRFKPGVLFLFMLSLKQGCPYEVVLLTFRAIWQRCYCPGNRPVNSTAKPFQSVKKAVQRHVLKRDARRTSNTGLRSYCMLSVALLASHKRTLLPFY